MPAYAAELRPFRIATYAVFFVFTLTFIGLVISSVARDLYGKNESGGAPNAQLTISGCQEQLESLNRRLASRLNTPITPRTEKDWSAFKSDWDTFTRGFEDGLRRVQADCVDRMPVGSSQAAVPAIAEAAERLDTLRQHLARCGEEGEAERESVDAALKKLRGLVDSGAR